MLTRDNKLRQVIFRPYRKGMGPAFNLTLWDTGRTRGGKYVLGYRLQSAGRTLFEGEDFCCAPSHAPDSDATVAAVMGFLTLRPGDTDREYFADYTPEQLAYCREHAEALGAEVEARFGPG